ncbi:hypothetical protein DASC09_057590 [Saccharomycopsis crataegensis]|uniref:Peptidase A1 domain-containing protein n=1 Tax=Saccharomycopsis crataegensis TaxID=43959 RepID=A0AAV5QW62_9ASCO|nr:hypothetical protein DASC09_057590 [Saccharomycopsis crataegensis]
MFKPSTERLVLIFIPSLLTWVITFTVFSTYYSGPEKLVDIAGTRNQMTFAKNLAVGSNYDGFEDIGLLKRCDLPTNFDPTPKSWETTSSDEPSSISSSQYRYHSFLPISSSTNDATFDSNSAQATDVTVSTNGKYQGHASVSSTETSISEAISSTKSIPTGDSASVLSSSEAKLSSSLSALSFSIEAGAAPTLSTSVSSATSKAAADYTVSAKLNFSTAPLYLISVEIGTPAQQVLLELDTGSSDIWVASAVDPGTIDCSTYGCYNSSDSQSYTASGETFEMIYGGSYIVEGKYVFDDITVNGAAIDGMKFAIVDGASASDAGIFGVGPKAGEGSTIASTTNTTDTNVTGILSELKSLLGSFWDELISVFAIFNTYDNLLYSLKQQGYIADLKYSVYRTSVGTLPSAYTAPANSSSYNSTSNGTESSVNYSMLGQGVVLFGGSDSSKYQGALQTFSIVPSPTMETYLSYVQPLIDYFGDELKPYYLTNNLINLYDIDILGVNLLTVSGVTTAGSGIPALIDTGTLISGIPSAAMGIIVNATSATYDEDTGAYYVPCDGSSFPAEGLTYSLSFNSDSSLGVEVGLQDTLIAPLEIVDEEIVVDGVQQCYLPFETGEDEIVTLGVSVMRYFYMEFDYDNWEISLALGNN